MLTFGEQLKRIRSKRGMSQRQVSAKAGGLDASAVKRIENDEREPMLSSLQALARGLNVTFTISSRGIFIKDDLKGGTRDKRSSR